MLAWRCRYKVSCCLPCPPSCVTINFSSPQQQSHPSGVAWLLSQTGQQKFPLKQCHLLLLQEVKSCAGHLPSFPCNHHHPQISLGTNCFPAEKDLPASLPPNSQRIPSRRFQSWHIPIKARQPIAMLKTLMTAPPPDQEAPYQR